MFQIVCKSMENIGFQAAQQIFTLLCYHSSYLLQSLKKWNKNIWVNRVNSFKDPELLKSFTCFNANLRVLKKLSKVEAELDFIW